MDRNEIAAALLASPADAILAVDRAGTIRFWNPGAVRIFGFTEAEAVGASLDIIIPENLRPRHWQGFEQVVAAGETRYGVGDLLAVPALTRDGHRISVEFTIHLIRDDAAGPSVGRDDEAALLRVGQLKGDGIDRWRCPAR